MASIEEYREVLEAARRTVTLLFTAAGLPENVGPALSGEQEWFAEQRQAAVGQWNRVSAALADPDPDLVYGGLAELRGLSRAMGEGCDWRKLAPAAVDSYVRYVSILDAVWSKLAETGTPEGERVSAFLPDLAAEFPPL